MDNSFLKRIRASGAETIARFNLRKFNHDQLPNSTSIRLLSFLDNDDGSLIQCSLNAVDLEDVPSYNALSYTWKIDYDPWQIETFSSQRTISCNGRFLRVSLNLYYALVRFRELHAGSPLWVDAICIDQTNITERGAQINLMGRIYSLAENVLVWLGTGYPFLKRALRVMEGLPPLPEPLPDPSGAGAYSYNYSVEEAVTDSLVDNLNHLDFAAIFYFFNMRWFHRAWVVQEIVQAKNLVYHIGRRQIPHDIILNGLRLLMVILPTLSGSLSYDDLPSARFSREEINSLHNVFLARKQFKEGMRWPLGHSVFLSRFRDALEPRDKVFAVLSISRPTISHTELEVHRHSVGSEIFGDPGSSTEALLTPAPPDTTGFGNQILKTEALLADYTKTTVEIYIEYAKFNLREPGCYMESCIGLQNVSTKSLIKSLFLTDNKRLDGLPSWVPDLTKVQRATPLRHLNPSSFTAAASKRATFWFDDSSRILSIQAHLWDEIVDVGELAEDLGISRSRQLQGNFLHIVAGLGRTYRPTKEPTLSVFWRTLIANTADGISPATHDTGKYFLDWLAQVVVFSLDFAILIAAAGCFCLCRSKYKELAENLSRFTYIFDGDSEYDRRVQRAVNDAREYGDIVSLNFSSRRESMLPEAKARSIKKFIRNFRLVYKGRRLFVTRKGYLGIGPSFAQKGDVVTLVAGASLPYLLRRASGDNNSWTLLGELYVHGLMRGEALRNYNIEFQPIAII